MAKNSAFRITWSVEKGLDAYFRERRFFHMFIDDRVGIGLALRQAQPL